MHKEHSSPVENKIIIHSRKKEKEKNLKPWNTHAQNSAHRISKPGFCWW
jgi:hypothetical protein